MITITETAQAHFRQLLAEQPTETHIRVFVTYPGSPQAECGVSYCPIEAAEEGDLKLPFEGFFAYIDQQSAAFLQAAEIDFAASRLGTQLTIKAPHAKVAKVAKVADDAPLAERVDYLLQSTINPQLAAHGGRVTLVRISEAGYALLQFGGGCNGCSMVDVTLKEGIEKELLTHFPELKGVEDITEHQAGGHSYY